MQVVVPGQKHIAEFDVKAEDSGAVKLRVKAHKKALYKWQYCKAENPNNWVTVFITDISRTVIGALESGKMYWFRVVVISSAGEHALTPVNLVVR